LCDTASGHPNCPGLLAYWDGRIAFPIGAERQERQDKHWMDNSAATFFVAAIMSLSGVVSTLAVYIWRAEVERRKAAEAKLAEYEQPAREATAELLRLANEKRRHDTRADRDDPTEGSPWPWSETEQSKRPGPRKPRR
jgi:hypothetical protein